jgi:mannose-6-phosphate isomerase-like protein (cupin superfamily)
MGEACVVAADAADGVRAEGDTALVATTIGAEQGCPQLEQRLIRFAVGRSKPRREERDDLLFVVFGTGRLHRSGERHELEPGTAAHVAAGETYEFDNPGPDELVVLSVLVEPAADPPPGDRQPVVRLAERAEQRADAKRTFRVLQDADTGCAQATQFVGYVEPYRAPDHSHPYDEVGYILAGSGFAHVDGRTVPLGPGSCFHLPPGKVHCIENVGPGTMRILGVFHSSDSPASRSYDAAQG